VDPTKQPGITIGQVYLESARFSHRADFLNLPAAARQDLTLGTQVELAVGPDQNTGVLRLTVSTAPNPMGLYELEIKVGALLHRTPGQENMTIQEYAANSGVPLLYPFVRETIANLTGRGRFGPFWLHPVNFLALGTPVLQPPIPTAPTADGAARKSSTGFRRRRKTR
jgi:preprotein translocase subunit SecB